MHQFKRLRVHDVVLIQTLTTASQDGWEPCYIGPMNEYNDLREVVLKKPVNQRKSDNS